MSFLSRLWAAATSDDGERQRTPAPWDDFWYEGAGVMSGAGQNVTPLKAIQLATVYACIKVLSETIASLPSILYRRLPNGGKERAPDHPLAGLMHDRPNDWQTRFRWTEMLVGHMALRGNSYHTFEGSQSGWPSQIVPLHPDRMTVRLDPATRRLSYHYTPPNGQRTVYLPEEVLHFRGLSDDGYVGLGVVTHQRETLGGALGTVDYAARFWKNDARPGLVFIHPGALKETAYERLKKEVRAKFRGADRHSPMVAEEGMKVEQIGMGNKESQFLEARAFSRTEIAGMFRVPPHMIGDLSRATFSNIEHQAISFVTHTIVPWAVRIEQEINSHPALLGGQDEFFIELLVEGLLRGDTKSRYDAYASALQNGWMSRNEVRVRENLNPINGGDVFLEALNMTPAGDRTADEAVVEDEADGDEAGGSHPPTLEAIDGRTARTGTDDR